MRTNFRSRTLFPNNILKNSRDQVYKRKEEPSKSKKEIKIVQVNNIYISKMIITVDFLISTSNNERGEAKVIRSRTQVVHLLQANSFCPLLKMTVYIAAWARNISFQITMEMLKSECNTRCLKKLKQDKVEPIMPLHVKIQQSDTYYFFFNLLAIYICTTFILNIVIGAYGWLIPNIFDFAEAGDI